MLTADLVRPRGSGGRPRARFIAHLGEVAVGETRLPAAGRRFWQDAGPRLAAVALSETARAAAERALAAVVPLPPELAELAEADDATDARSR